MTRKKAQPVVQPTDVQVTPEATVDTPVSQQDQPQDQALTVASGPVIKPGVFLTPSGATLIRN